ncbi:hypothetical protein ACLB2K_025378 [Fragaria x ananassa]
MVDEVSRLAAAMAITENGRVSFGAAGSAAFSGHPYAVGRLLSPKKKVVPKAFMATMGTLWDLKGQLQIRANGDRYVLRFNEAAERKKIVEGGPWFYGKTMFALSLYDGQSDVEAVPIQFMSV